MKLINFDNTNECVVEMTDKILQILKVNKDAKSIIFALEKCDGGIEQITFGRPSDLLGLCEWLKLECYHNRV